MNKKGFEFKSGLFSVVAISMLVLAFGIIIAGQSDFYGSGVTSEVSGYNRLNNMSSIAGGYRSGVSPDDPEPGSDPEANTFRGVYGILTNIFSTFDLVLGEGGLLDSAITQFGLPSYVRQGIITFMLIAITFSLIAVIFRLGRTSA